jgi:hypothetical protein
MTRRFRRYPAPRAYCGLCRGELVPTRGVVVCFTCDRGR